MVTTVYIVRHCESMGNVQHRFQGRFNAPISPRGEQQLDLLSLRFRNEKIDVIYTSPLDRAYKTAQAVARFHDVEIHPLDDLSELDVGDMTHLTLDEIGEKFPVVAKHWNETPDLCEFPNGETMKQSYDRVNAALDKIIDENRGKTIVITTHGGAIRNIDARITKGCVEGVRTAIIFDNTGVGMLTADDNGKLSWQLVNDLSHLPPELRKSPVKYKFNTDAV